MRYQLKTYFKKSNYKFKVAYRRQLEAQLEAYGSNPSSAPVTSGGSSKTMEVLEKHFWFLGNVSLNLCRHFWATERLLEVLDGPQNSSRCDQSSMDPELHVIWFSWGNWYSIHKGSRNWTPVITRYNLYSLLIGICLYMEGPLLLLYIRCMTTSTIKIHYKCKIANKTVAGNIQIAEKYICLLNITAYYTWQVNK